MDNQDSDVNLSAVTSSDTLSDDNASTAATSTLGTDNSARPTTTGKRKLVTPTAPLPVERVGNSYRLTQNDDWGIRYAALMLGRQDGTRRTQQDLVDQAVREFLDRLRKKGIQLPDNPS